MTEGPDKEKAIKAAEFLTGTHDFTSFRASGCQAKTPIKTLDKIVINKEYGDKITLKFEAKSFLYQQIRLFLHYLYRLSDRDVPREILHILPCRL